MLEVVEEGFAPVILFDGPHGDSVDFLFRRDEL